MDTHSSTYTNEQIDTPSSVTPSPRYYNIAAYYFVTLNPRELEAWRPSLKKFCIDHSVMGTILLTPEGVNLFLAGVEDDVKAVWDFITANPLLSSMTYKASYSDEIAFTRIKIKLKQEIIPMGRNIKPAEWTAPRVTPIELKQWLDEGKDVVLLDTRNNYEVPHGTFENAMTFPQLRHFRKFPDILEAMDESMKEKTIVTFCTGGIRCEKAGALMVEMGFGNVYQLDGGILKYFEEVGGDHYTGNCFVFDGRISLDATLTPDPDLSIPF